MSLTLLLEKYDVSTDEGLQKALKEIEKEETDVDEALSNILAKSFTLEGKLRTASQAYTKLGEVKNEALSAADMVDRTAALARDVSAKVRQLDLARSRVAECQRRVHDLIDLQSCSAGVEAAIKANDFETAAGHVARFLSMDPGSVAAARARGAPDPRQAMSSAADTLREKIVRKFEEAARKEDDAAVDRFFKLFPQIGRAEEGVDLLGKYLAKQAEVALRRASTVAEARSEAAVFADAFTRALEAGGAAVQRAALRAAGHLPAALARIQPVVCAYTRRLYNEMRLARRLEAPPGGAGGAGGALQAEPALAELALTHSTIRLYFSFLLRKTEQDAAKLKEEQRKAALEAVNKIIAECDLMRTAQDILGHYLTLERYFLEESISKALRLSAPPAASSRLVDDVLFVARKVIRRSVSTGSIDGVCAVLNETGALLEREVASALRRYVRNVPPDPLPFVPPPTAATTDLALGMLTQRLNRDVDAQRALFLEHMTEAEAGAEWSERLALEACQEAEPLCRAAREREQLASCAAGLAGAAAAFRAAHHSALAGVRGALKPTAVAWAKFIVQPSRDAEEVEDDADLLPAALESLAEAARAQLAPASADLVLCALVTDIVDSAAARLHHYTYDKDSGFVVERRARRLATWAGGAAPAAREACAALVQAAAGTL